MQQVYGWRGMMAASSVVLYLNEGSGPGQVVNLAAADQSDPDEDGLHKEFVRERTVEALRIRPFLADDRWLLVASPAGRSAAIIDLHRPEPPTFMYGLKDVHDTRYLLRTHDGRRLVQLNTDGRFHIYEIPSGKLVVSGRYVDDEIIFYTPEGYYWSSYEGAHYVHARFAGRDGLYSLQQFARVLNRPDIVKAAIAGTAGTRPNPGMQVPPGLEVALNKIGDTQIELAVAANASAELKELRVYQDGKPTSAIPASGATFKAAITIDREPQARWLTVVAVDTAGLTSIPVTAKIEAPQRSANTLRLLAVGVDEYDHLSRLAFAKVDAETLAGASRAIKGSYYADVEASLLKDREATADQILKALSGKASEARAGDTLMLFYAGHGARSPDGRFFMTTSTTRAEDLDGTALEWSRIAKVLGSTKARIIVVLDACHSGQTGAQLQATNDDAVAAISGASRTPMLVLAASKGRQFSEEMGGAGGGVFTQVLAKLITQGRDEQDLNRNGVLEVSEIFRGLKDVVTRVTNGRQTPWLVRQDMVGDFAVF
ncbi:MAG: caspase family protein [Hyphomicrobium sp.]